MTSPVEKHSRERIAGPQISPLRSFGAPVEMTKGRAALPLSVVAEQTLFFITLGGPRAHDFSGRDDKGEGGASIECGCRTDAIFITLGGPRAHDSSGRDDKGRTALPATVVAEQEPFSIALDGPKAH